ncbi:TolC family protein [Herbaspirillum frisingense]|uniref:TolC family protein n=1 Tax=Herbaspirillum frisingense TaxID=92645 RepID=UPI001F0247AD|nr:efflux transporter outer membrane subunit [Herbaspirillum frisingense]
MPEEQAAGEVQVQASFDLDLFGRLQAGSKAAQFNLLASQDARDTVRLAVVSTVLLTYFNMLALDARLGVVDATRHVRREQLRSEQARFDAGYSNALDLARAQAELESTLQLRPALALAISQAENSLSSLSGRLPGPIERGADLATHKLPVIPASLPANVLRQRPDIAAAEARLAASDKTLDAARAAFLPDIRLAASGGFVGSTLVHVSPVKVWSLGSSVLAPLFDFGRLQSQQEAVLAEREEAAYGYRKVVLQAFEEIENQLAAVAQYQQQYGHLLNQRNILAHSFAVATRRYDEGYASRLDTLDAQRTLLNAELSLVQSRLNQFQSAVNLMHALGGGWQAAVAERLPG